MHVYIWLSNVVATTLPLLSPILYFNFLFPQVGGRGKTMVKFSKELEAQLIPEWKDAFVNYWKLKKIVKKIKLSRRTTSHTDQNFDFSPLRLARRIIASTFRGQDQKREIIKVRGKVEEDEEAQYATELVEVASDQEDVIKEFFQRLNGELEKVNQFYITKEKEFIERGETLNNQLQMLVDLKQILHDRRKKAYSLRSDASLPRSNPSLRGSDYSQADSGTDLEGSEGSPRGQASPVMERNLGRMRSGAKIDIPATTPGRMITAVTTTLWEDLVRNPKKESRKGEHVNKKNVESAEKMIRGAFVELYKGLGLLETYSSLNAVAFRKILKKFDKVADQQASGAYMREVKRSHFISSDKVARLSDEVESIFTQHFSNSDRKKAMKFLRPQQNKDSHMISFLVGLFTGCFVTLFSVYGILAHVSGMFSSTTTDGYLETVYPVFSMFALFSLHVFLYGCNLFTWKSTRINYNFIFEFSPSTALKHRDAFLMCTAFMTMVVSCMVVHLLLRSTGFPPRQVDAIPAILLLLSLALLICPFNIFYRSNRYCFLRVIRNIVASPFYKVEMVDFFMADQLTSQIPLLRHMEFTACYFLAGSFKTHQQHSCTSSKLYKELAYVISFMPYYWRAMQCARRWFDEGNIDHIANLGKYVSAMMAAGAKLTYAMSPTPFWFGMLIATCTVATVYQLYWDFVKDWGLLNQKSKNPWLRDDLVLKKKEIYYFSIGLNLLLRLAWVEAVIHINLANMDSKLLDFFLASLEIIRRGHWNFYRLENEHLKNVGNIRAVKAVPLPFRDLDADG